MLSSLAPARRLISSLAPTSSRIVGTRSLCSVVTPSNDAIEKELMTRVQHTEEIVNEWKLKAMSATLHQKERKEGCLLPGWHQLFCLPFVDTYDLSEDGYEPDFAPPKPYIARMWGGSNLQWETDENKSLFSISVGDTLQKKSFIKDIKFKEGKKSGKLLIMTLSNEYSRKEDQQKLLVDDVSMIYRTQPFAKAVNNSYTNYSQTFHKSSKDFPIVAFPSDAPTTWTRTITASSILLFRYSALTFNAHMIHYDQAYSNSEGFTNSLVHGPLQAQFLLDLIHRIFPNRTIINFKYRALAPLLNNETFQLSASITSSNEVKVTVKHKDIVTMEGAVTFVE